MSIENTSEEKPCVAEKLIGTSMKVRFGRKRRVVEGIVQEWRYGFGTVEMLEPPTDGRPRLSWPSFEVKIKPNDGSKAVWVGPFKDSNNPRPSEIFTGP